MPELPDVTVYCERLAAFVQGRVLQDVTLRSPFVLRTVSPALSDLRGLTIQGVRRLGKRIVLSFEGDLFLVIHLMIAGRLRWKTRTRTVPSRGGLAGFHFEHGMLLFTEASKKKRASLHVVKGQEAMLAFDRGGIEPLEVDGSAFAQALRERRHTLKRALTDPRIFSGIGNAYSDEILFRARLSPLQLTTNLSDDEVARLFDAVQGVLEVWVERLRNQVGTGFPDKVTAFHPEMCVHGRFREPCTVCGAPIQRIAYAERETNYCASCQTGGRLLRDRAMSVLMKRDWPKTLDELEAGRLERTERLKRS